jgi:hypothetical protein
MNIKRALKQLQKTGAVDNSRPGESIQGLSTFAEIVKDITAHIYQLLFGPQSHFGNNLR